MTFLGVLNPGQVMGASGAGKPIFLHGSGRVLSVVLLSLCDAEFKKVIGFVDQEDTLISTLTVYETILYSALLRLLREMNGLADSLPGIRRMVTNFTNLVFLPSGRLVYS